MSIDTIIPADHLRAESIPTGTAHELLENGARPTTPAGDNLLLDYVRTVAAGYAAVADATGGRTHTVEGLGLHMADAGSFSPFGNQAHLTRPIAEHEAAALCDKLSRFFGARDGGAYLLFSPFPTPDLSPHGFGLGGHPPFMVRPAGGTAPMVGGLQLVEVRTPAVLADFERTIVEAYPAPEVAPFGMHARLFCDGLLDSAWTLFVGYLDGESVATAGAFVGERVVAVEAVSTRPEVRGRGYGAAITAAASLAAPNLPAALVSSEPGRRVYEGLGFLPVSRFTLWVGQR